MIWIILIVLYSIKTFIVYRLRRKRDIIDLSTPTGKLECRRLNEAIDILNGGWIIKRLSK